MAKFLQDVRYGLRMIVKSPGFALVAVITLALGIGANSAIFSVVNALLLRPLPYHDPDRLVVLSEHTEQLPGMSVSYPNYLDWRDQNQAFEQLAAFQPASFNLTGTDRPERFRGRNVSANFFSTLGVRPMLGRDFRPADDRPGADPVVIVSHRLWQQRFGGEAGLIGRSLQLNARNYTVIGILPPGFQFYLSGELFTPLGFWADEMKNRDSHPGIYCVGRLKPGMTLEGARAGMATVARRLEQQYPKTNTGHAIEIVSLSEDFVGDIRRALLVLLGAVGFVLLIACANVANLLLARAAGRQREIAIRTALGARRGRIVGQLLTESVILAVLGGGAGLVLALWGIDFLVAFIPDNIRALKPVTMDMPVLWFTLAVSLLTGIVFGLAPAVHASRTDLNQALKEGGRSQTAGAARGRLRTALVVFEVAVSLVLLVGAALMARSFYHLRDVNPGFDPHNVLTLQLMLPQTRYEKDQQVRDFFEHLVARVKTVPGVEEAGLITPLPFSGEGWQSDFYVEGTPVPADGQFPNSDFHYVSRDYLRAMRIPLVRGRHFAETDQENSPQVIIINRTMARRYWPNQDPLGKRLKTDSPGAPWRTVVGVVGEVRQYGLDREPKTEIYVPIRQTPLRYMTLVVRARSGDAASLAGAIRSEVEAEDKDQPVFNVRMMEKLIEESFALRRLTLFLLGIFGGVAFVLAAVGIYGVMSYAVNERTHEIGIRMALGAQQSEVFRLVVGEGMLLTLLGVGIGLAGAFALTRLMATLLYRVSATDPASFLAISALLGAVALVACYVPARRAARVDPVVALRYE